MPKKKKKKKWIQKAEPKKGRLAAWCKREGFRGVNQSCINEAIGRGGHPAKMANFAINVSGKYCHPRKGTKRSCIK